MSCYFRVGSVNSTFDANEFLKNKYKLIEAQNIKHKNIDLKSRNVQGRRNINNFVVIVFFFILFQ